MGGVMKGNSIIVPGLWQPVQIPREHQGLHCSFTSCSTILCSHFRLCRRVRQQSSHTIRLQQQWVLLLDSKFEDESFGVKHVPSSIHGDIRALKQQRPWPKEMCKDAFNLYSSTKRKRYLDVQYLDTRFDESRRPPRKCPSLVTQIRTEIEPRFPSTSVDQSKTRDMTVTVSLGPKTPSSTLQVVRSGSKLSSKPVSTVSTIPQHRRQQRGEKSTFEQGARSTNNGRPAPQYDWFQSRGQNMDRSKMELERVRHVKANLTRSITATDVLGIREPESLFREEVGQPSATSEAPVPEDSVRQDPRSEELIRKALWVDGQSPPAWMKAWHNLVAQGRLQSCATYGSRDWSRDNAQGNGSMHMHSVGTARQEIAILNNRLQRGITVDSYMYVDVLSRCSKQKDLFTAKQIHNCIRQSRMDKNPYVARSLLNLYIQCGALLDARRVFDEVEKKTVVIWTLMITGYAKYDHAESAVEIFNQMRQEGCRPNEVTYLRILKACASRLALKLGKEVHECIRRTGFESDVRIGTALVMMYAKCGCIKDARQVFENLTNRDVITWTVMIGALAQHGRGREAYRLFLQMKRNGFQPNAFTYASILNSSASAGGLDWVKEVHGHARIVGLDVDLRVGSALVHIYAQSGNIDDARLVFEKMEKRDVVTWTSMIGGLARHGCGHEALALFRKMNADHVMPNRATFVAVFSACCHGGLVDEGRRLFSAMKQDYGIEPDVEHYTCMVDLFGRAGFLEEAKLFISEMPVEPNAVTWGALLGACRTYGNVELGELAAEQILKLEPNSAWAYVLLSNIYAAAGNWEKKSVVRKRLDKGGLWKEPGRSWIEVDEKIHEFVAGDTSHPEAKLIYTELNKLTSKLKDEGYVPDTRVVLHDMKEEDRKLALCSHSEKLAIAFGIIHIPLEEPIVVRKNLRVCLDCHTATKFISKVTGRKIIARDANRFHHFKDGACSCGDFW